MLFADRYWMDIAIMMMTYIMLGWGLNIVIGLAGLLDLGYVAFYAVGAYSMLFSQFILAGLFGFAFPSWTFCGNVWNFIRFSSFKIGEII